MRTIKFCKWFVFFKGSTRLYAFVMDDMNLFSPEPFEETNSSLSDRDVGEIDSRFSNDAVPTYTWQELFKYSSNEYTGFVES